MRGADLGACTARHGVLVSDIPTLIASGGVITGIGAAFAALLRANLLKDKLVNELVRDMLEATKAGARADYAVAAALQRIEQKLGLVPSNAGAPPGGMAPGQPGGQP